MEVWQTKEDGENRWHRIDLPLDEAQHGKKHRIEFIASYLKSEILANADIAIDDVSFTPACGYLYHRICMSLFFIVMILCLQIQRKCWLP